MGHSHGHHGHHHPIPTGNRLGIAFALTWGILLVLAVGGWYANSLALMADAGHALTDVAALGLSWYATVQATKPPDARRTFGYHRTGIIAALVNAASLIAIALFIGWEAIGRLSHPEPVAGPLMIAAATVALGLNLLIGLGLNQEASDNLNVRSAYLHVMGDAAASAGVILAGVAIYYTGLQFIDPALSIAIAALIAWGAWGVVDESLHILMEGVPADLAIDGLMADLRAIDGVREIHHLHVWSIARGMTSLSCHVVLDDQHVSESMRIIGACNALLAEKYQIAHTTIQAEAAHCSPDAPDCNLALVQGITPHDHDQHDHGHHDHGHDHHHDHDHHHH